MPPVAQARTLACTIMPGSRPPASTQACIQANTHARSSVSSHTMMAMPAGCPEVVAAKV